MRILTKRERESHRLNYNQSEASILTIDQSESFIITIDQSQVRITAGEAIALVLEFAYDYDEVRIFFAFLNNCTVCIIKKNELCKKNL